jgi:putative ABC transport system permease protein
MFEDPDGDKYRIVGVVRQYYSPTDTPHSGDHAVFYAGVFNSYEYGAILIVRAAPGTDTARLAARIEEMLASTEDMTRQFRRVVRTSEIKDIHYGPQRMTVVLMGLLVALLLFVASLGVAGLTSFSVTDRTRQIGVRRALGATTSDILRYFLTESGLLTTMGLMVGAGLAVLLNMVLLRVYTDAKLGGGIVATSALLLWVVGIGAALPPALRGARTSPAIATRNV